MFASLTTGCVLARSGKNDRRLDSEDPNETCRTGLYGQLVGLDSHGGALPQEARRCSGPSSCSSPYGAPCPSPDAGEGLNSPAASAAAISSKEKPRSSFAFTHAAWAGAWRGQRELSPRWPPWTFCGVGRTPFCPHRNAVGPEIPPAAQTSAVVAHLVSSMPGTAGSLSARLQPRKTSCVRE